MRYSALILDHDDTAVDSSASIHYPAHLEVMKSIRPAMDPVSLDGWFLKNFDPGIMEYFLDELGMSDEEVRQEYHIWRGYTKERIPAFYPGFLKAIRTYRSRGGRLAVVSHSEPDLILRDYRHGGLENEFMPELVFGWDPNPEHRKPNPYPVFQILESFGVAPENALIIDDLKPGVEMGRRASVAVAAAGWGHHLEVIRSYMERECVVYLRDVTEFERFILR